MAVQTWREGASGASRVDAVMQQAVDEAARLLRATGAFIDLVDNETGMLRWAYVAGVTRAEDRELLASIELAPGKGLFGMALAVRAVVATSDYLHDLRFPHTPATDRFANQVGIRSVIAAPLLSHDVPLGVLAVYSDRTHAFTERHETLTRALADHAAATMTTNRLIEELARSRDEIARRVETARALREIAAGITRVRPTEEVLQEVADQAKRLLRSDGAHVTLKAEDGDHLQPFVMAGVDDEETRTWLRSQRLEPGSGTNAIAAQRGEPVWTSDYRVDPHLPHGPGYGVAAERMRMVAIAAVPMRGPERAVVGTLSISYPEPREFAQEEIELLQALADQAAIAVMNGRLYERLRASEARYRYLVEQAPDLLFATDAEGRFTFLSDACEAFTGWQPEELIGRHHSVLTGERLGFWRQVASDSRTPLRVRLLAHRRDGGTVPIEVFATGDVVDGRFAGVHGACRDLSESEQLEAQVRNQSAELAASDERARLARELHDSVTQALFSMSLTRRSVEMLIARDGAGAAQPLAELRTMQRDALAEMRALIFSLRPPEGEATG